MSEYIDRKAVMDAFAQRVTRSNNSDFAPAPAWNSAVEIVEQFPAADVQPVVHAHWVSVTERLPKEGEVVLTWGEQGVILFDWLRGDEWCCFGGVTHWMPLPQPPTEQMVTDSNQVQEGEDK